MVTDEIRKAREWVKKVHCERNDIVTWETNEITLEN
jgi:hypothetical protein